MTARNFGVKVQQINLAHPNVLSELRDFSPLFVRLPTARE